MIPALSSTSLVVTLVLSPGSGVGFGSGVGSGAFFLVTLMVYFLVSPLAAVTVKFILVFSLFRATVPKPLIVAPL